MADKGWIHKYAFEDNALAADTDGRAAMQDGYLTNAKIADSQITAAKLASGTLNTGIYGVATYGQQVYG